MKKTKEGLEYDPKTQFVKRRRGRSCIFDKQLQRWRKFSKAKGALKDSKNYTNPIWNRNQLLKRLGMGS